MIWAVSYTHLRAHETGRILSQEKIEILKEQHYQNLKDDMRGVVSGIVSAPAWICREIDLEEGANWFLVVATCLDLIHSNKEGKIITKYTDHFHNNLGWSIIV